MNGEYCKVKELLEHLTEEQIIDFPEAVAMKVYSAKPTGLDWLHHK